LDSQNIVLEMRNITKKFPGVTANDDISISLKKGEVLALLGENGAGKSSLMNVLVGLYRADSGSIYVNGERVFITSPSVSSSLGIGMIHQEFMLVDTMTVAENIILGIKDLDMVPDMKAISAEITAISEKYQLKVNPSSYIWQLSVGERQRVEILKLIFRGANILILDEPTAVLTPQESKELNSIISQMKKEGKSAIFITHKMDEVMAFSEDVYVLKQGKLVASKRTSETNPKELAQMMVGREILFQFDKGDYNPGKSVLTVKDLCAMNSKGLEALKKISFDVKSGEIFGIAGVAGNGQQQLIDSVTGLQKIKCGSVFINKTDCSNKNPIDYIKAGVSYIPSDRLGMGVAGSMTVLNNLAMKGYREKPFSTHGLLIKSYFKKFAEKMIDAFKIATPGPDTVVKFLSGGNIQKAILAREIDSCRNLLVAAYPSRGLDVGATQAVRTRLIEQRDEGKAVLLVSEELDELMSVADRIAVMFEGQFMGIVDSSKTNREELGLMMTGMKRDK